MLHLVIRYSSILLCSDYIYQKLLNLNCFTSKRKIFFALCGIPFALLFSNLPSETGSLSYIALLIFHFFYHKITSSLDNNLILISLLFSYGICYGFFVLSALISGLCLGLIGWFLFQGNDLPVSLLQMCGALFMYLFSKLSFHIPRFKKGMPFLKNQHFDNAFSLLALSILLCVTFVFNQKVKETDHIEWIIFLFLLILLLLLNLFIVWRNQLRQTYLNQLKERDIKRLEEELTDCQATLEDTKEENQKLSKLIHRDNKQLASLQLAVEQFLSSSAEVENQRQIGDTILQELKRETINRQQILSTLVTPKSLPTTQIPSVDHLLHYMLHRAQTYGIHLELSLSGNMHYLLETVIKERDFLTLLADILENALIATKCGAGTKVLLHMGIIESIYTIDLWDAGIPFRKESLLYLGKKQYTTHKPEGGSGIGLMSTYELLEKYEASLHIDESLAEENMYTKKLSILFDSKREYHLYTNRNQTELAYLYKRKDLQIFNTV